MPSQQNVDSLLINALVAGWNATGVRVVYENDETQDPTTEYMNFMSLTGTSFNVSIGNGKKVREPCTLIAEIRIEKHVGKGRASELAKTFQDIFMNRIFGGYVHCSAPSKESVNTSSHYGINVSIPYYWDYVNGT